jgi:hypothetical protein
MACINTILITCLQQIYIDMIRRQIPIEQEMSATPRPISFLYQLLDYHKYLQLDPLLTYYL